MKEWRSTELWEDTDAYERITDEEDARANDADTELDHTRSLRDIEAELKEIFNL